MIEISFLQVLVFITLVWIAIRAVIAVKNKNISISREAQLLLMYICIIVIVRIVYFPMHLVDGHIGVLKFDPSRIIPVWYNLVPIIHMFDSYDGWLMNIIGNVTMFIPVGIIWPICDKKLDTIGKTILAGAIFPLCIELTQMLFYERCTDIDDFLMNTTGIAIGAVIYFCIKRISLHQNKEEQV